jgi:hypothetical protein
VRDEWQKRCRRALIVLLAAGWLSGLPASEASSHPLRGPASPYQHRALGYDLSYPNCVHARPTTKAFAIVGVNGGKAFTFNSCLGRESGWYPGTPSAFYLNTGYELGFRRLIVAACRRSGSVRRGSIAEAYAIGCSEAASSVQHVTRVGLASPAVWWLDVETANSWSPNHTINTAVVRGIIDFLSRLTPSPTIGIYSRPRWWREITAGWRTETPEWVPSSTTFCPPPFSVGPVWLHQTGGAGIDLDKAC